MKSHFTIALLLTLSGCGIQIAYAQELPSVVEISASPAAISVGETSTITWEVANVQRCVLQYGGTQENVPTQGSKQVIPTITTAYKLWCADDPGLGSKDGPSVTETVTVTVNAGDNSPILSSVSPSKVYPTKLVRIRGKYFEDGSIVEFMPASGGGVLFTLPTEQVGTKVLKFHAPEIPGTYTIRIGAKASDKISNSKKFTVRPEKTARVAKPVIVTVSPKRATSSAEVIINGKNFEDGSYVELRSLMDKSVFTLSATRESATKLAFTAPTAPGVYIIRVGAKASDLFSNYHWFTVKE